MLRVLKRTTILIAFAIFMAVLVNTFRPNPISWVAAAPYEIFTDCPETEHPAKELQSSMNHILQTKDSLFIDARTPKEYESGHVAGAINIPYDPLFPVSKEDLQRVEQLVSKGSYERVIVYGDPDSARLLAGELMGAQIGSKQSSVARFLLMFWPFPFGHNWFSSSFEGVYYTSFENVAKLVEEPK